MKKKPKRVGGGVGGCVASLNKLSRVWLGPSISLEYYIDLLYFDLTLTGQALCILFNNEV